MYGNELYDLAALGASKPPALFFSKYSQLQGGVEIQDLKFVVPLDVRNMQNRPSGQKARDARYYLFALAL